MITTDEILKYVTDEAVIKIMEENGSPLHHTSVDKRTQQKLFWFRTICHDGDSHKLCYFTDTKDFYCYTNCGRMTFFNFICKIRNIPKEKFYESIYYVSQFLNIPVSVTKRTGLGETQLAKDIKEEQQTIDKMFEKRKNDDTIYKNEYRDYIDSDYVSRVGEEGYLLQLNKGQKDIKQFYDPTILNYFDGDTFYKGWIDEGISIETMRKYNIRWYEYMKHIIIPHYDIDGNLIGIRRRSLRPEDTKRKYMPEYIQGIEYEHSLAMNLYGLYQNKKAIEKMKTAIIVEAEKSVLLSDTYYGDYSIAVATCGFNISDWQMKALSKLDINTVYLAFDKDYDWVNEWKYKEDKTEWNNFVRYKEKILTMAYRLSNLYNVRIIKDKFDLLQIKDSPFDRGKKVFETLRNSSDFYEYTHKMDTRMSYL